MKKITALLLLIASSNYIQASGNEATKSGPENAQITVKRNMLGQTTSVTYSYSGNLSPAQAQQISNQIDQDIAAAFSGPFFASSQRGAYHMPPMQPTNSRHYAATSSSQRTSQLKGQTPHAVAPTTQNQSEANPTCCSSIIGCFCCIPMTIAACCCGCIAYRQHQNAMSSMPGAHF